MEERTLTTSRGGRPSFLDKLKKDSLKEFRIADKRVGKMFHFKTVFATKLMEEQDKIDEEIEKIAKARRKGYRLEYKKRIVNKELEKLGIK